ncbi:MAG: (Fe-S)-binding protein [Desulfovibrio sp.]|nr:(Fe-S)-binding protein [Desulfovibrio sp.]
MSHPYAAILSARNGWQCVDCGKCAALCPMAETALASSTTVRPNTPEETETTMSTARQVTPRGAVQQALAGEVVENMPALVHCLQCRSCSDVCPAGVDVAGLIADLRQQLHSWHVGVCAVCGTPLLPATSVRYLSRAVGADFAHPLAYTELCPDCKRRAYVANNG